MKAQFVYEALEFERGRDPRSSMGVGITKKIGEIIDHYRELDSAEDSARLYIALGVELVKFIKDQIPNIKLTFGSPKENAKVEDITGEGQEDEAVIMDFFLNGAFLISFDDATDSNIYAEQFPNEKRFYTWVEKIKGIIDEKKGLYNEEDEFIKYIRDNHQKGRLDGSGRFKILKTKLYKDLSKSEIKETWKSYGSSKIDPEKLMILIEKKEGLFYGDKYWITIDNMRSSYKEDSFADHDPDSDLLNSAKSGTEKDLENFIEAIESGGDINQRDLYGESPLTYAALHGNVKKVKILLDAGADKEHIDDKGKKPIDWAKINIRMGRNIAGYKKVIDMLS